MRPTGRSELKMRVLTIGFTKKSAQRFFHLLRSAGVKRVVDVRLNNASQLAGFANRLSRASEALFA